MSLPHSTRQRATSNVEPLHTRCILHNIGHHDLFVELYTADYPNAETRIGWCRPLTTTVGMLGELLISHIQDPSHTASYGEFNSLHFAEPLLIPAGQMCFEYNERDIGSITSPAISEALRRPLAVRAIYAPLLHEIVHTHEPSPHHLRKSEERVGPLKRACFVLVTTGEDLESPRHLALVLRELIKRRWALREECAPYEVLCHHIDTDPHQVTSGQLLSLESLIVCEAARVATQHGEAWRDHFRLYLSVNTGTPMMIAALTLTFAEWSPIVLSIPKARQLLRCTPTRHSRVYLPRKQELSSIKEWVKVSEGQLNAASALAVRALREWRDVYLEQRQIRPSELKRSDPEAVFFHRKGLKEVLCIVVICDRGGVEGAPDQLIAVRGLNLEVSLPTGTLCAERNAIGSALCRFPQLERRDIKAVAVLSLDPFLPKLGPCGTCQEWLRKVTEVSPDLRILSFESPRAASVFIKPALLT